MDRREKRRKFHQAIIDMLYPLPTRQQQLEEDPERITSLVALNHFQDPESFDSPSSSSDDNDEEGEPGPHKLTRAQRKRLRKKKLKESASSSAQRREIIGPMLPSAVNKPDGDNGEIGEHCCQGVRQNAAENQSLNRPSDTEECNAQNEGKSKRRRIAKKLAREKMRPSHHLDGCDKDGDSVKEWR